MTSMNANAELYTQDLSYPENEPPYECLAQPWFVRVPHPVYYPRHRCSIEPLICGENVFRRISGDLKRATRSVDIITWGFDPGMVLVRGATAQAGQRYGDLLKEIATRNRHPVEVRLLVWHDDVLAQRQTNSSPGFYGERFPSVGSSAPGYYSEAHQAYNAEWYAQVCAGKIPNIHFQVRKVPTDLIGQSLSGEAPPSGILADVSKRYGSHHQKMVLIDYENPDWAIGYVMGHNSITDFWDTENHLFRDPRRETFYSKDHAALQAAAWKEGDCYDTPASGYMMSDAQQAARERLVQSYIDKHSHVTKPYQDVSCRLRGAVLYDLNHNFCQAWSESTPPSSLFTETCWLIAKAVSKGLVMARPVGALASSAKPGSSRDNSDFIEKRKKIALKAFNFPEGRHSVQLLRTQPLHGEKAIKECYANLTRQALHYIFIQNQYLQYQDWADHLIECVGRLRAAGYLRPIYVFILTSTPESSGMDRPTYAVASKLGNSESMKVEHEEAVKKARAGDGALPITPAQLQKQGINVIMGSLWTCAQSEERLQPSDYEEIYIHAKVAIVDDAAFTIGSANLNVRSMALDSELNVLSIASDVAFQLRADLFIQCTDDAGPGIFSDMTDAFQHWLATQAYNNNSKNSGRKLKGHLLPFYVNRKPGLSVL